MSEGLTFRASQLDSAVSRAVVDISTIDLARGQNAPPGIATLAAALYARHPLEVQAFFLNPQRLEQLVAEVDPQGVLRWGPAKLREASAAFVDQAWRGHDANVGEDGERGVSTEIDPMVVKLLSESIKIAVQAGRSRASIAEVMNAFADQPEFRERFYELTGLIFKRHPRRAM